MRKKILMTLALLLTAVTGAWATTVTWNSSDFNRDGAFTKDDVTVTTSNDARYYGNFYAYGVNTFTTTLGNFTKIEIVFKPESSPMSVSGWTYEEIEAVRPFPEDMPDYWEYTSKLTWTGDAESVSIEAGVMGIQSITFTIADPNAVDVEPVAEPAANTKQWTFTQPGSDVVLTPLYAPTATWATMGTEPEVKTLLPEAAEGVIAGTDDPLIVEGTGIVAFAGTSTEDTQGTVMYAVTPATVTDATELISSDWKNTVPTAKNIADNGATVKVWYYIQGADTPDGEDPTADNTFNNSEVSSLTVTVLSNKFDLTLKAANANTIDATDASKGTVSVKVGTDAAVNKTEDIAEGKLTAIKMGSEVKLSTKAGYKFRKVEVKKASTPTLKDALADGAVTRIKFNTGSNVYYADFTYSNGSFTRTGGSNGYTFSGSWTMKEENGVLTMTADYNVMSTQFIYFVCTFNVDTNEYTVSNTGSWNYSFSGIEVNGTDITSQLTKVK